MDKAKDIKEVGNNNTANQELEEHQNEVKDHGDSKQEDTAENTGDTTNSVNNDQKEDLASEEIDVTNSEKSDQDEEMVAKGDDTAKSEDDEQSPAVAEQVEPVKFTNSDQQEENNTKVNEASVSAEADQEGNTSGDDVSDKHGDDDEDDHDDDHHEEDYSEYSKEQLVELIKTLGKDENVQKAERIAREIKPLFDEIREHERKEALEKFIAEGGAEEDFDFKFDELANRFDANFKLIRDKKNQIHREKEQQKDANLKRKQEILEKLRHFVDTEETNISFNSFKELQTEWKNIGPIPGAFAKTLWANYNALVDRFYDNRSIYFELKELDRRKNLESKLELVQRVEKLVDHENLKEAIKELNELHDEFKHLGPVPQDEQEALWQKFKGASDAVYARRKVYVDQLKSELDENLKIKDELADQIAEFATFDSDRIKEWNVKTKEILDVQKKWEAVGGLPRAKAKAVNKKFWGTFKTFFNNKNAFFKKLDAQREGNLDKKKELVLKAQELKESQDWQKTADQFKQLQREWKEIGPVPEKYRESIYKEFKEAADAFFNKKRTKNDEAEKDFEENLQKKEEICSKIEKLVEEGVNDLDKLRDLQDEYMDIGFVPRNSISKIKSRYSEAVDKFINSVEGLSNEDKQQIRIENQVNKILSGPNADQKIYRKEQTIRKQVSKLEHDIALWKNNLEFFADSKKANKLKDDFNEKIELATNELQTLKQQLKIIRTVS